MTTYVRSDALCQQSLFMLTNEGVAQELEQLPAFSRAISLMKHFFFWPQYFQLITTEQLSAQWHSASSREVLLPNCVMEM